MKRLFRDYFIFNKRERNGVFVLIIIIIILIIYLNVSDYFLGKQEYNYYQISAQIETLEKSKPQNSTEKFLKEAPSELFYFNPNNLPEVDWQKLGLTQKQVKIIKNYESKGGRFRKKEDVKKMYGLPEELYLKLEPYIIFEDRNENIDNKQIPIDKKIIDNETNKTTNSKLQTTNTVIELNTADSALLTTIKGIGPFYAKSIIKQRNLLGGFYKKEQLLEIWKFDEEKLNAIEKYISVNASSIKKININTCSDKELKHPYLTWNMVNAIINYRKKHGNYKTIDEIKKTDLITEETFGKIEPYLIIE